MSSPIREPGQSAPPVSEDGRLVGLSDAVFAIALTLIVLTIAVPNPAEVPAAQLAASVRRQWPEFLSYAISFWVVALFWFAHRRLFRLVVADDMVAAGLNIAFLFAITFLPYPTDMVGNYRASRFAVAFYDVSMIAVSLLLTILSEWITAHPALTGGTLHRSVKRSLRLRSAVTAGPFLLSLLVSPINVPLAHGCWLLAGLGHLALQRVLSISPHAEA